MAAVRLYHGTTVAAAESLRRYGSRPPDIDALLAEVSERFGVTEQAIRAALQPAFLTVGARRDEFSVAMHPAIARLYAGRRGGEAHHEAVTAALRLTRPELTAADAAVRAAELIAEPPALVALDVPFGRIEPELPRPRDRREPWTHEEWTAFAEECGDELARGARNLRFPHPVDPSWIAGIDEVEPVVGEFSLHRYVPDQAMPLVRGRSSRPPSIGPRGEGVYTRSAITAWLAENGFAAPGG